MTSRGRILIVDDESNARNALAEILKEEGFSCETAADGFKGLGRFSEFAPDLVLTDLRMPGMDGVEFLRRVRELSPGLPVIVTTAFGAVDTAVRAMQSGAVDYLTKPIHTDELLRVVHRALGELKLRREARELKQRLEERYRFDNIIGSSLPMQQLLKVVSQVAASRATVLITGEPGTGKELIASAIHQRSSRAAGPFVKLHCGSLPEAVLEAELLGSDVTEPNGQQHRREGRFEQSRGGTLFLDEIADISPAMQVKLLRVLLDHELERAAGRAPITTDTRLVVATNRDLRALVNEGRIREDLYYRLSVIEIQVPRLRERASDIPALAIHFLRRFASENGRSVETISEMALARMVAYDWPGNVRELENVMERAVVLAGEGTIEPAHLPPEVVPSRTAGIPRIPGSTMADIERYAILTTLEAQGGSTSRAAEVLGISVRKIQYKLQEYGAAPKSGVPAVGSRSNQG